MESIRLELKTLDVVFLHPLFGPSLSITDIIIIIIIIIAIIINV